MIEEPKFNTQSVDALAAADEPSEIVEVPEKKETLSEYLSRNGFTGYDKSVAIGYIPVNNPGSIPVKASTVIDIYKLRDAIEILLRIGCDAQVIQIREDGILVFRESDDNNVGLLICPLKDIEKE